jgi:hypothetical protein
MLPVADNARVARGLRGWLALIAECGSGQLQRPQQLQLVEI